MTYDSLSIGVFGTKGRTEQQKRVTARTVPASRLAMCMLLLACISLGISACGDSHATPSPTPAPTPTPTPAPTPTPTPTPTPPPTISALSPVGTKLGGPSFTLTVDGANFVAASVVQWNGSNRPTTFVSSSQLTAQIPASDIVNGGKAAITVSTPPPRGGTSSSLEFNLLFLPRFAYVTDFGTRRISTLSVDLSTGQLRYTGYAPADTPNPAAVALHPSGQFGYVANEQASGSISMFSINAANGVLTSLGAPVAAGDTPIPIAVDPLGRFAYAPNLNTNTISIYAINATTSVLSPIRTGSVAARTHPIASTIDPSGKFLYASHHD